MRYTPSYQVLAAVFSFATLPCACVLTDGDDEETIGSATLSSAGDSEDTGDDDAPTSATMTTGSTTSDPSGAMTSTSSSSTDDPTDADSGEGSTTVEDPTDGGPSCKPGPEDSACEVCIATSCCAPFIECSEGGSAFACDCHASCLDEGYPENCSQFCGPAPAEFPPLLACAQAECAEQCGL